MTAAARQRIPADWESFQALAVREGWSDGLPLVPPTEARVARFLAAAGVEPNAIVVDSLPPRGAACTNEQLAVNAVMTGAPPAAFPLAAHRPAGHERADVLPACPQRDDRVGSARHRRQRPGPTDLGHPV